MPTVRSICHGGIWRALTRALIDLAHGRASVKVMSDIGASESGRWHDSHFSWKIGAMSFVNVGVFGASAAAAAPGSISATLSAHAPTATFRACPGFSGIMFRIPLVSILRSDGHFDEGIGPAALKAEASLTRFVVGLHAQQVLARR